MFSSNVNFKHVCHSLRITSFFLPSSLTVSLTYFPLLQVPDILYCRPFRMMSALTSSSFSTLPTNLKLQNVLLVNSKSRFSLSDLEVASKLTFLTHNPALMFGVFHAFPTFFLELSSCCSRHYRPHICIHLEKSSSVFQNCQHQ